MSESDLVERLRDLADSHWFQLVGREAADEIERLRQQIRAAWVEATSMDPRIETVIRLLT